MHISKIHIKNYRNFNDFTMDFHKGLNVIIGANNSGKTGLLYAIKLLNSSSITIDDFNKNNLMRYSELYTENAPSIVIEYYINHKIIEDDTTDESIVRLLPFLGITDFAKNRIENDGKVEYNISAKIYAEFSLDIKFLDEYKKGLADVKSYSDYIIMLSRLVDGCYSWNYTNGISTTKADAKSVTNIFDIRFIEAERTNEEVRKETKKEIEQFAKKAEHATELDKFKKQISEGLDEILKPSTTKLSALFENEHNEIGLEKGNVAIASVIRANLSVSDSYVTEVKDTKNGYNVPLKNNGLGYNNLIDIYMLIKLSEVQKGKDFRILCLEEPEAHLHPAMQYKLFKYLSDLDQEGKLNQQLFVTTHSSNISAVAGIDNMFMLAYDRNSTPLDCSQQSLEKQFQDVDDETKKQEAKKHLTKFLDVTRSDMLFADKVILVEGIAEKLLLPIFMEKCNIPYEDEHISIVEIGGKNFENFVELFNGNAVKKKVLCITDRDFKWIDDDGNLRKKSEYESDEPSHIKKLKERFNFDEFYLCTQSLGGRTFEDELFLANVGETNIANKLLKMSACQAIQPFCDKYKLNIFNWSAHKAEIDGRTKKTIEEYFNAFDNRLEKNAEMTAFYANLIFAELFLHYAENRKGDLALKILTDESLYGDDKKTLIAVPQYIQEGLEWLK